MTLIRGKFIDPTAPIRQNQDPVANNDLARKSYVDNKAATEAALAAAAAQLAAESYADGKVEDALVDGVTDKAPSQNVVVDALSLKADASALETGPMQLIFGSPDGLFLDHSEFLTYDASIGFLLNVGGQLVTRSLAQDPVDPQSIVINDKVEVFGDDGTGSAYTRINRDYLEAKKVLPTKELSASAGFDGTDSWLGVSETTNSGNNISMIKLFPNKAQLFTVDIGLGNGPQPILPIQPYDLTTKKYVDDEVATKQNSLGTGTTSQYLRGDLTWQTITVPTLYQSSQEVFVDPILGSDAVGRGGRNNPYATINYAYSQVSLETGNVTKWANEKIVFKLAPGVYTEDLALGFKRRSVMITGTGVKIMGKVTVTANRSDYPTTMSPLPYPWSTGFSSPTFEICGQGGGMEDGFTSNNIIVQGQVRVQFAGLINWSTQVGPHYVCITNCQLQSGLVGTYENASGAPGFTVEIDSSSVDGGNIGVMPYVDGGTTTGVLTMSLKAHNSQLKSTLGPKINILEIDGCRIVNIDRTYGGITNGLITATNSTSYSGIVSSTFAGTVYKIGKASGTGTDTFKMDAMSYGSFKEKTIDNGTGTIAYNLIDKASGISVATAAVNYTRTSADVEAALVGIDNALGTNKRVPHKESKILTVTDISNGYINITRLAIAESTSVHFGGAELMETDDYTVSTVGGVTRITFSLAILALMSAGDKVYTKYWSLT